MIGFFIFGVIYAEILNEFKLFNFTVNPYIFAGSISLIFLFSELIIKHFQTGASLSDQDEIKFKKIKQYYYICLAFLGFVLLVATPFIWWGTIKRLADIANEGIR
jgi:preprotein translocase subunit SecY